MLSQREFELVSVVGLLDLSKRPEEFSFGPNIVEELEEAMGASVGFGPASSSAHGDGVAFVMQRHQMDVLLIGNRVEARSLKPEFDAGVAERLLKFFSLITRKMQGFNWLSIGYNFIVPCHVTESTGAGEITKRLFRSDLNSAFPYSVKGGAAWLWMDVEESTLLLKLEPHRNSITTPRISANANFSVKLDDNPDLPDQSLASTRLQHYEECLDSILRALKL